MPYNPSKIHYCWSYQICESPYASWFPRWNSSHSLFNISSTKQRPGKVLRDTKLGLVLVLSKSHILTLFNRAIIFYNVFLIVKYVAKKRNMCMCCMHKNMPQTVTFNCKSTVNCWVFWCLHLSLISFHEMHLKMLNFDAVQERKYS